MGEGRTVSADYAVHSAVAGRPYAAEYDVLTNPVKSAGGEKSPRLKYTDTPQERGNRYG